MFADILKRLRTIYGYSAREMSQKLKISPSYLSEIETGKKKPTLEILEKCAAIFEIKLSTLVLLSESYDDAKMRGKTTLFIRDLMVKLINKIAQETKTKNEAE